MGGQNPSDPPDDAARYGWQSTFPEFGSTQPRVVRVRLQEFLGEAGDSQIRAWDDSIPKLQTEVREVLAQEQDAGIYTAILEYELPLESRRPDVVLLVRGAVVILELKGKSRPTQADLDQAAAYARDLKAYHRHCADRPVHAVVVPTAARGYVEVRSGVHVTGPDALDSLIRRLQPPWPGDVLEAKKFLSSGAYCPLPTLVEAARELFRSGELRRVWRASAATDPAVEEIARIVHEAARTKSRRLVLLTGVPGSGKTLVGLRIVHAHFLDDLAVGRADGKPTAPAVFLSGNGPLVEVLQYELKNAGGGGKTFVRGVRDYVKTYSKGRSRIPPEHVLVFDEAQRAWDSERVAGTHGEAHARSEPEHFVEFAMRIPEWCVVIGLIGGGQEIHVGEEAGLGQWRTAVEGCSDPAEWTVHAPPIAAAIFSGCSVPVQSSDMLNLDREIRFHLATDLHAFVESVLEGGGGVSSAGFAKRLESDGHHLRLTRDLDTAKRYLRDRYREDPTARFGILASSRAKDLEGFGIPNDFQSTKVIRHGPWFGEGEDGSLSCRHLRECVTEYGAQGLELDGVLLAWGTDFLRDHGKWSNALARRYKPGTKVHDPYRLRLNAYRVLLTRARDVTVVYVPLMGVLDETAQFLLDCGFTPLAELDGAAVR